MFTGKMTVKLPTDIHLCQICIVGFTDSERVPRHFHQVGIVDQVIATEPQR